MTAEIAAAERIAESGTAAFTPVAGPAAAAASGPATAAAGLTAAGSIVNAMTVDVEDYFQVSAFAGHIDRSDWERQESRVERNTEAVLAMFADHRVTATFFTLGWVAVRHPALIRRIVDAGHELASHGWEHVRVSDQSPLAFRTDAERTKKTLEDLSGEDVTGYRAASFSIGESTPWAFDVLAAAGYRYSSSVYPIRHDHYGMPAAPRFPWHPSGSEGLIEIPVTTVEAFGRRWPAGGGGYFRLLPYALYRRALGRLHAADHRPAVMYFHPWEIDPGQPRLAGVSARARFRHYTNLNRMEAKLRAALGEFRWDRMDRVFPGGAAVAAPRS